MNYEDMSDFEVNKWVWRLTMTRKTMHCHGPTIYKEAARYNEFDPCNNPSDAWPIILQTCMTIELPDDNLGGIGTNTIYNPMGTNWQCDYEDKEKCFRAAMICFLKMKDAEK